MPDLMDQSQGWRKVRHSDEESGGDSEDDAALNAADKKRLKKKKTKSRISRSSFNVDNEPNRGIAQSSRHSNS